MSKTVVGLDIGSSHLRAVEVTHSPKGTKVTKVASVPLGRDTINSSQVMDGEEFTKSLKLLWKTGKFSTRDVRIAVSSHKVLARSLVKDWMVDSDFSKVLPVIVKEDLPAEANGYYLDYHTLEEFEVEDDRGSKTKKKKIFLAGAPRRYVDELVFSLQSAGLKPQSIDILGFALLRAKSKGDETSLSEPLQASDVDVFVDMGAENTTVVIFKNNQPIYLRVLSNLGGYRIDDAIINELDIEGIDKYEVAEQKKMDVLEKSATVSAARARKMDSVFENGEKTEPEIRVTEEMIVISRVITGELVVIMSQISDTLDDYLFRNRGSKIRSFTISGGVAGIPNIASRLSSEFKTEVTVAKPFDNVKVSDSVKSQQYLYAGAYGLALGTGASHG